MLPSPADRHFGSTIRAIRIRLRLRQADASARAGISQSAWSRVEGGNIEGISVGALRGVLAALGGRLDMRPAWQGAGLDRVLDEVHARIIATVVAELARHGWTVRTEVTYSIWGERGAVDVLAWHASSKTLLVIEVKSELGSTEELIRRLDAKVRLAPEIVRRFGLRPASVQRLVVLADERSNRRAVARHDAIFSGAFPTRGWAVRQWLARPLGVLAGLWFVTPTRQTGPTRNPSAVRRVRLSPSP